MYADDSFKFSCPFCAQHVRAYEEHCGDTIECPGCAEEFIVPLRSYALKNEIGLNPDEPRLFDDEELDQLYEESPAVRDMLIGATNVNCWEFTVTSHLLRTKLSVLENLLAEHMEAPPKVKRGGSPAEDVAFLDTVFRQFCGAFDQSYLLLISDLNGAMYRDSVTDIIRFIERVGVQSAQIESAYRNLISGTVSDTSPSPEMVGMLKDWAVHYWSTIVWVADQLEHLSETTGRKHEFQISLVPPSIYEYYHARASIN
jgi:hypothetical protein